MLFALFFSLALTRLYVHNILLFLFNSFTNAHKIWLTHRWCVCVLWILRWRPRLKYCIIRWILLLLASLLWFFLTVIVSCNWTVYVCVFVWRRWQLFNRFVCIRIARFYVCFCRPNVSTARHSFYSLFNMLNTFSDFCLNYSQPVWCVCAQKPINIRLLYFVCLLVDY